MKTALLAGAVTIYLLTDNANGLLKLVPKS